MTLQEVARWNQGVTRLTAAILDDARDATGRSEPSLGSAEKTCRGIEAVRHMNGTENPNNFQNKTLCADSRSYITSNQTDGRNKPAPSLL